MLSAMTASIERLEKMHKKTPGDLESKTALADAYFNRAIALTDAAQYRAHADPIRPERRQVQVGRPEVGGHQGDLLAGKEDADAKPCQDGP